MLAASVLRVRKVKVIKMLVTVVVVFGFSWLPLYVVNLRRYYGPEIDSSSLEFSLLVQVSDLPPGLHCARKRDFVIAVFRLFVGKVKQNTQ